VRLEELGQLKNPMTSSGIVSAVSRLVAQSLNQLRYRVALVLLLELGILIFWWISSKLQERDLGSNHDTGTDPSLGFGHNNIHHSLALHCIN
jgi:hypothetical protein